jgi:hypothetical protein
MSPGEAGTVPVTGCPCGELHRVAREAWAAFERVTEGLDPVVRVHVAGLGAWMMPRLYPVAHSFKGAGLPRLAAQYGWERA